MRPIEDDPEDAPLRWRRRFLYNLDDAAWSMGDIDEKTVRGLIGDGELAFLKIGRRVLVPEIAIEEFVAARMRKNESRPPVS